MIVLSVLSVICIQIIRAEVKMANFIVEHNLPLAVSDHLTPLVQDIFSDSMIAKKYASCRTKATSILNFAIAPHFRGTWFILLTVAICISVGVYMHVLVCERERERMSEQILWCPKQRTLLFVQYYEIYCTHIFLHVSTYIDALVESMKSEPFSLLIDDSNDTSLDKVNPLTVRIYDVSKRQVTTQLLDMCTTSGRDCGTASAIFGKVDSILTTLNIPWNNCVGFGVDNTGVNVGRHHSIKTQVQAKNPACYFMGCPCHLLHNIACHASEALHQVSKFDVCVDIFYSAPRHRWHFDLL